MTEANFGSWKPAVFEDWAILELFGHRRLAGKVTECTVAGSPFLRIDVHSDDTVTTQYYSAQAVYCITPTTEAIARALAKESRPEPVHPWELPALRAGEGLEPEAVPTKINLGDPEDPCKCPNCGAKGKIIVSASQNANDYECDECGYQWEVPF